MSIVLPASQLAADTQTDLFTEAHSTHRLSMRLDFDPADSAS